MRLLVTGADGFVGRHAVAFFRARGDVVLQGRGPHPSSLPPDSGTFTIDVTRLEVVRAAIEAASPDAILHLAGASSVAESHRDPAEAVRVNALGVTHLLDATKRAAPRARVVIVSSSEVYGRADRAVAEDAPVAPRSPYAASKLAGEIVAEQFARAYDLDVTIARPFNHIGAGQARHFVVPSFAAQIAAARGSCTLRVGDLTPVRDFSHVDDVVEAYALLLARGAPGEVYNVGSGHGRTIRSIAEELGELAGVALTIEVDEGKLRPAEIPSLVGDATKLRALGWRPTRTVRSALADVLAEARG